LLFNCANLNRYVRIREDIKRGVYVEGLTEEHVTSSEEAYGVLKKGAPNRYLNIEYSTVT